MVAEYPDSGLVDGGVQAATRYLAEALVELDRIELHVISFRAHSSSPGQTSANGLHRHLLPRQRLGAVTRWHRDFAALERCLAAIRPDVVHGQGAGVEGYLAVRSGYPSVVTFHGMIGIDARFKSTPAARFKARLHSRITERYCALNADHVILINPYVETVFGELLRGRRHHIPNPTNERYFVMNRAEQAGRILFAGRITPLKGVAHLIRALPRVLESVDADLVLAGAPTDREYFQSVKRLVEELGLTDRVHFHGLLGEDALLDEFSRASVLVLPSLQENSPMVIQQAMAGGIPVVASRVGGVAHVLEDGKTGWLVEPEKPDELAGALVRVLGDPSFRHAAASRSRQLAERFRAGNVAEQTLAVYRSAQALQQTG